MELPAAKVLFMLIIFDKHTHKSSKSMKSKQRSQQESDTDSELDYITRCKYCGLSHKYGRCPAYNKTCKKCHKRNHFKAACKAGKAKSVKHIVAESSSSESESEDEEEFFID